jgi:D-methionine transport system substrate-binding protein
MPAGAALALGGCGGENNPIKIGVTGLELRREVLDKNAKEIGADIEWAEFSDCQQPNPSAAQGETDLNQFQHILPLSSYNVASGEKLVSLASTVIHPL